MPLGPNAVATVPENSLQASVDKKTRQFNVIFFENIIIKKCRRKTSGYRFVSSTFASEVKTKSLIIIIFIIVRIVHVLSV